MNGAPGSSWAVLLDQVGANNPYVVRPIRSALHPCIIWPIARPILGSNPYSIDQAGLSITPSSVVNSCTTILPIAISFRVRVLVQAQTGLPLRIHRLRRTAGCTLDCDGLRGARCGAPDAAFEWSSLGQRQVEL